jgi:hypothetical protein
MDKNFETKMNSLNTECNNKLTNKMDKMFNDL